MKKHRGKSRPFDPEVHYWRKVHGPAKTRRSIHDYFPRLYNRRSYVKTKEFEEAGYPMAVHQRGDWQEVHAWCREQFRNAAGVTYSWTGERFWFQTEADRDKFAARWG